MQLFTAISLGTNVTTVESIVVLPRSDGNVESSIFLPCIIDPPLPSIFEPIQWVLPSGATVDFFSSNDQYTVIPNISPSHFEALLVIERLSYSDTGRYICEYEKNDEILSVSVDLVLEGKYKEK